MDIHAMVASRNESILAMVLIAALTVLPHKPISDV
jgi:hypothetical protein